MSDILIVGAGPAGSATAIELARRGQQVTLVDRAAFPRPKPCSEYLNPRAVAWLDQLGVLPLLRSAGGQPLHGSQVFGHAGGALTGDFAAAPGDGGRAGLSVTRTILDATLVDAARRAGATVMEQVAVRELIYEGDAIAGAVLEERSGTTRPLKARVVVGADGLRSMVARRIGVQRYGRPARLAFVAHLAAPAWLGHHAQMHLGAEGYVGLNRVGPDLANVALVLPQHAAAGARGDVARFFFAQLERFPALAGQFNAGDLTAPIQVTGPFAARSSRIVTDGALLVGDAADFFDPFTGEGIYRALQGASLAAEAIDSAMRLGRGRLTATQLASYVRQRRATFAGKWAVERMVGFGMLLPSLFDRAVRRIQRRGMAHTFIGVTADLLPARAVLNPWFLTRMVL